MAIKYLKKAIKTPSTDDHKTRKAVPTNFHFDNGSIF